MAFSDTGLIQTAVIEGWHPFDVPGFRDLFKELEGIDPYHQTIENWGIDCGKVRNRYDVTLFYNMNNKFAPECDFLRTPLEAAVAGLGEQPGQGIVVLHHAILAYPENAQWSEMVGIADRSFGFHNDQTFPVEVASPDHPITRGVRSWEMFDETYTMAGAGSDSEVLLTTPYEKSMRTLAWTRKYRNARVFCFQLGHDARSWADHDFRRILAQGIHWAAGRI